MKLTFPIRSDKLAMSVEATAHIASVRSDFQQIDVYDTPVFGKALLLDGHIQLTEFDERAYHESLVWVPLLNVSDPRSALVVGGGDGGVLRELCKHAGLQRVDMVEIDEEVVNVCRRELPSVSGGAFDDSRVNLHIGDAFEFVKGSRETYDLVVVDCTDVYEDESGELSERLFTKEFYSDVKGVLSETGLVVTQADNPVFCPYSMEDVLDLFGSVFERTGSYWAMVPSFGGVSGFVWGSRGQSVSSVWPLAGTWPDLTYLGPSTYETGCRPMPSFGGTA